MQFVYRAPATVAPPTDDSGRDAFSQLRRDVEERSAVRTNQPLVAVHWEHVGLNRLNIESQGSEALRPIDIEEGSGRACQFRYSKQIRPVTVHVVHGREHDGPR